MAVNLDLTITLSSLIETGVIAFGGAAALITLRNTTHDLKSGLASFKKDTREQFDGVHSTIAASKHETKQQFGGIQEELKKMGDILVAQGRFDERLIGFDKRLTAQGRQIDELRRGEGFIRGAPRVAVDGEYDP